MADFWIIDKQTRIIRGMTTSDQTRLRPTEELVSVVNKRPIPGPNTKLGTDGDTFQTPTQAEMDQYADNVEPNRIKIRLFTAAADDILNDAVLPEKIKTFVLRMKELLS